MTVGVAEFTGIALLCNMLCSGSCAVQRGLLGGLLYERVNLGLKLGWLIEK